MSLLDEYSDNYVILDKLTFDDGYGGYNETWKEGATIKGALAVVSEEEMKIAEAAGEKITHTLLIDKSIKLDYHTVLRRSTDNKIFRTTSKGDELYTPSSSRLNKRKINIVEWELPAGGENGQNTSAS